MYDAVIDQLPLLMRTLQRRLKEKSPRTRQCVFVVFAQLAHVVPNVFANHLPLFVGGELL